MTYGEAKELVKTAYGDRLDYDSEIGKQQIEITAKYEKAQEALREYAGIKEEER